MVTKKTDSMQIIIPMTGLGSRFKVDGYTDLKPFIKVHGRYMIDWVVSMFEDDRDQITFICQEQHLNTIPNMEESLREIAPNSRILPIDDWVKRGPVGDILRVKDNIDGEQPVLISYCDFYMHWDYRGFCDEVISRRCDGAVPCYTGYHPHLRFQDNLYASCKVDEHDNLIEIREKYAWHSDKTRDRHSPGIYYFKSGEIMKTYCQKMVDENDDINGEFYASLPYNYMVKDNKTVWCPTNVRHFCQWGTPEDLEDYLYWVGLIQKQRETQ